MKLQSISTRHFFPQHTLLDDERYQYGALPLVARLIQTGDQTSQCYALLPFYETTDQIRLRLAWPCSFLTVLRVLCVYALRASDEKTGPEAESRPKAVVSKRAYLIKRRYTFVVKVHPNVS